jgi:4-carboxymuconolactone decarboxylase
MRDKLFEQGLKLRKQVLGAEYVERQLENADAFSMPMQMLATKSAWGMVWTRPGLPRKVRSMLNIAMLVALGKSDELELHIDGAIRNGVTKKEIGEILLHCAIYCGYPAALGGFRTAREYFAKHGAKAGKRRK